MKKIKTILISILLSVFAATAVEAAVEKGVFAQYKYAEALDENFYAVSRMGNENGKALFYNDKQLTEFIYENIIIDPFTEVAVVSQRRNGVEYFGMIVCIGNDRNVVEMLPIENISIERVGLFGYIVIKTDGSEHCYIMHTPENASYADAGNFYEVRTYEDLVFASTMIIERQSIQGWEDRYIEANIDGSYTYNIVDGAGKILIGGLKTVDNKAGPGSTLIISTPLGHYDKIYRVIDKDLNTIVRADDVGAKPVFVESNNDIYIKMPFGEEMRYYDLKGNCVQKPAVESLPINLKGGEIGKDVYMEVFAAIKEGIVPEYLQCFYSSAITRKEFCRLAIAVYEKKTSIKTDLNSTSPFTDVNDPYVTAAYDLGIISAAGDKTFNPYGNMTRQEAAVMLVNLAKVIGVDISAHNTQKYVDEIYFASWAKDAIYTITAINDGENYVMTETEGGKFSPWMNLTREGVITALWRLYSSKQFPFS